MAPHAEDSSTPVGISANGGTAPVNDGVAPNEPGVKKQLAEHKQINFPRFVLWSHISTLRLLTDQRAGRPSSTTPTRSATTSKAASQPPSAFSANMASTRAWLATSPCVTPCSRTASG